MRQALALAEMELRRMEFAKANPRAGAARKARIEIGAAVAHLDRALLDRGLAIVAAPLADAAADVSGANGDRAAHSAADAARGLPAPAGASRSAATNSESEAIP